MPEPPTIPFHQKGEKPSFMVSYSLCFVLKLCVTSPFSAIQQIHFYKKSPYMTLNAPN